jgi:transposase
MMAPSLDELIAPNHGVRLLDELLGEVDWAEWEALYKPTGPGHPALHPRMLVGAILYGLLKGAQSTRSLEEATRMRIDFHWLLEGRTIDHTTFCKFLIRAGAERVQRLFQDLNRAMAKRQKATLADIFIDGTRLRANSNRHGSRTAASLEKQVAELDAQLAKGVEELSAEAAEEARAAPAQSSAEENTAKLEAQRARQKAERDKLARALDVARERDKAKKSNHGKDAHSARVPVTDPDAHVIPNKEGGYAPNYTPVVAVDAQNGFIGAACVAEGQSEAQTVGPLTEQIEALRGAPPERIGADSKFAWGQNLEEAKSKGIGIYAPVKATPEGSPVLRQNLHESVSASDFEKLPMCGKKLAKEAFVYDPADDCYYCPMGRALPLFCTLQQKDRRGHAFVGKKYRSKDCSNCPLTAVCLSSKTKLRQIRRDQYDELREETTKRMQTEEGKAFYGQRAPRVEGVFGTIKAAMGIRRFLRRGHEKVSTDWLLICAAFNVKSLIRRECGPQKPLFERIRRAWRTLQQWWSRLEPFKNKPAQSWISFAIAPRSIL